MKNLVSLAKKKNQTIDLTKMINFFLKVVMTIWVPLVIVRTRRSMIELLSVTDIAPRYFLNVFESKRTPVGKLKIISDFL